VYGCVLFSQTDRFRYPKRMQITLDLSPEMEAELRAQADLHGLDVTAYIQNLIERSVQPKAQAHISQQAFKRMLDHLAEKAPNVPHLRNETFSRNMIYRDHD
jgi:hypothetical protein